MKYEKQYVISKPIIRRFWADFKKAKQAAQELYNRLEIKETVYIFKTIYGIFENKGIEYSLRLGSEGAQNDSITIIARINEFKLLS
jgi:hypothetical protein